MRISKDFLKSSLIYTLAGALPMASAIILLPFYVKYLSTSDFGALSIYFGFSYFVQLLATYSFDTSVYIHFHEYKEDRRKLASFVSSAFMFMLLIGSFVGLILAFSGDLAFRNIFAERSISFQPYGFMAVITGIFQALFKVHGNFLQSREKPGLYLWSNVISFALIAIVTIVGLQVYPESLAGPVGGRLVAAVASGIWALSRIIREFGIHFNVPLLRSTFSFNFYTFIYQLLQWVINYFDRIFMVFFLALAEIGVYDFALKCLLIIEFILNGLHNSFYPKVVSRIVAQDEKGSTPDINRYYHAFIGLILLLICVCIATFPTAIKLLVRKEEYQQAIGYIPYLSLIYIFRAIRLFYATPYGILKYTQPLSLIYLIVSAIKILLMWVTIRDWGLYGVIAASIVAAIAEIGLLKRGLRGKYRFRYNQYKILIAPGLLFVLILVLEPIFGSVAPLATHFSYLLACLLLLAWIYRNEINLMKPFNILR